MLHRLSAVFLHAFCKSTDCQIMNITEVQTWSLCLQFFFVHVCFLLHWRINVLNTVTRKILVYSNVYYVICKPKFISLQVTNAMEVSQTTHCADRPRCRVGYLVMAKSGRLELGDNILLTL